LVTLHILHRKQTLICTSANARSGLTEFDACDIVASIAIFLPKGIVLAVFGPVREDGVVQS
jgi:hypothetical protein